MVGMRDMSRAIETRRSVLRRTGVTTFAGSVLATLLKWRERSCQRRRLQDLDARLRSDVGLTVEDVRRETAKRIWSD